MQYRTIPRTGDRVGILGMGAAAIGARPEGEIIETVEMALEGGVNLLDTAGGHAAVFHAYGKALAGARDRVLLQVHFGAEYLSGKYGWTTDADTVRRSVEWELEQLRTDYIDYGFIHCLDEEADLKTYMDNGVLEYILQLQKQGIVRHIGLSSHTPALVHRVLDIGIADLVMFSVNPAYDYGQGKYSAGGVDERQELYRRCQKEGVGISVMKVFCAGQLLDAARSPLGAALTKNQCIRYALDKPGVVSVLPGCGSRAEVQEMLAYLDASPEETDYSIIGTYAPEEAAAKCVYCAHCHPCPAGLDIGLINKYYDLARMGDTLAREHYLTLEKTAADCIGCGHCNARCPFMVDQAARMEDIRTYFGK